MQDKSLNAIPVISIGQDAEPLEALLSRSLAQELRLDEVSPEEGLERDKEDEEKALIVSLQDRGEAIDVAAFDADFQPLLQAATNHQAVVLPPEASGGNDDFSLHPLVWTAAGIAAVALLDSSDSGSSGGAAVNRPPAFAVESQQFTIDEDQPLMVLAEASDPDGDELSYDIPSQPQHGDVAVTDTPGEYLYTPDAEFSGEDSFVVRIRDGKGGTATQTVTIVIDEVNDAPVVAASQTLSGAQDQLFLVNVPAQDAEGDPLTYTFTEAGSGSVSRGDSPGSFLYTPESGFTGTDSFTVIVSDGNSEVTHTVNLRVGLPNEAPEVEATQTVATDEDEAVTVTVSATDVDGDNLSYIAGEAANGTVEEGDSPGKFVYTPDEDFNGQDSFEVTVSDGKGGTATQTVTVDIAAVEDIFELTVADVEAAEGDDNSAQMVFELSLDRAPFNETVIVTVKSSDGSATAGDDFVAVDTTVTFEAGQQTAELVVDLLGDTVFGIDETFTLTFSGDKLKESVTAEGTLLNDDLDPTLSDPLLSLDAASDTGDDDADGLTNDATPSFTVNAQVGADVELFANGESIGTATAASVGVYTHTATALGEDGEYHITARVSFEGINGFLESAPLTLILDTTAPTTPVLAVAAADDSGVADDDGITSVTTPTLLIVTEAGSSVEVFADGDSIGFASEDTEKPGQFGFTTPALDDGAIAITAVATDAAGNSSLLSGAADLTIDTSAPTIAALSGDVEANTVSVQLSEDIGLFDDSAFDFTLNGVAISPTGAEISDADTVVFNFAEDFVAGDHIDLALAMAAVSDVAGNVISEVAFDDDPAGVVL